MPYDWSNKVIGHEYIRIMRAKVEAGTATEDEKRFLAGKYKSDREWTKTETRKLDKLFNQMFPYKQCSECGKEFEYGVVNDKDEFFCFECADMLDQYYIDTANERDPISVA